jgi:hypothetical protein
VDDQLLARVAADLTLVGWNRTVREVKPLGGGMNSATALVELADGRAVLKWVPRGAARALMAGCAIARQLAQHGLVTGEPIPTITGELTHQTDSGAVALLQFVDGEHLSPASPKDQQDLATTLAAVHAVGATRQRGPFMGDQILAMVHDVEPWVRPTVDLVLEEYDFGPVLYDVASALMYLGGRQNADSFWAAYVSHSPAPASELAEHVGTFTRYRAAVQAAYFSMRIASADRTGIDGDHENWKGLRDAELMLRANGMEPITDRPAPER